jgi:molybdate transport system ATP-binding protein
LSAKLQAGPSQAPNSRTLFASIDLAHGSSFRLQLEVTQAPGITILFGASGAGKTTLLESLAGLVSPDRGRIVVGDTTLFDSDQRINIAPQRRRCGYLFQTLALFPHMTVQENIEYGLSALPKSERRSRSNAILESFHVAPLAHRKPERISGGERQRVALARALVTDPAFLLLDEPLSGLDAVSKGRIIDDLRAWNCDHNIPILYVTHDHNEAFGLGDRVLVLESGRIVAEGTPHQVLDSPRRETVAQLVGFENVFDAVVQAQHEHDGTMTCRLVPPPARQSSADLGKDHKALERFFVESGIGGRSPLPQSQAPAPHVTLEVPLSRVEPGQELHVGIRAGDIMISVERPSGLSARNLIPAEILSITLQAATAILDTTASEDRSIHFIAHVTPRAVESLKLSVGDMIWLVLKTHSCHVMKNEDYFK